MMKWEYLSYSKADEIDLNKLGDLGWELVCVVACNSELLFYFKRPKL